MGAEGFGEFEGATDRAGAALADNAQTDWVAFKRSMELNVANSLDSVVGLLNNLPGPAQTAISTLAGFAGLAAPIGPFLLVLTQILPLIKSWELVTKAQAAAQWLLNAALAANPIGIVIGLVLVLVGGFILLYQHCEGFRKVVDAVFSFIWNLLKAVVGWYISVYVTAFKAGFEAIGAVLRWLGSLFSTTWNAIKSGGETLMGWFRQVPGWIGAAFAGVVNAITWPFRTAFNAVARMWNSTVAKIRFTVPDWVPVIGGRSFSIPSIPMLAAGGLITGAGSAIVGERGPEMVNLPRGGLRCPAGRRGRWRGPRRDRAARG